MKSVSTQTEIVSFNCKAMTSMTPALRMDASTETLPEVSESETPIGASGESSALGDEQKGNHSSPQPPHSSAPRGEQMSISSSPRQLRDRVSASSVTQKSAAPAGGGKGKSVVSTSKSGGTSPRKKIQYP